MTITSTEQFTALADGATIRVRDETWTRTGDTWISATDSDAFTLSTESFLPDVAAGRVTLSEAAVSPARNTHGFTVGQPINTEEELEALPIGTIVGPNGGETYRVEEGGVRSVEENHFYQWSARALSMGGYNHILSLPEPPVLTVGRRITTNEEFMALPVGTTVRYRYQDHEGYVYAKRSDGWYDAAGERFATTDTQAASILAVGRDHPYWLAVESLPDVPTSEFTVGQRINRAQRDALPVGSRLRYGGDNGEFALKGADGVWRFDGEGEYAGQTGTYSNAVLNHNWYLDRIGAPESSTGQWAIGQTFSTVEEVAALPIGTELQYMESGRFRRVGPDDWRLVTNDETLTDRPNSDRSFTGGWRLVHLPRLVTPVTLNSGDTVTVSATPVSGDTIATTVTQGLAPERVQEMLHGYLHDQDGLDQEERDGIIAILDSLGLEHPAPEMENITVRVDVRGTWNGYFDEHFRDHIGGDVSVNNGSTFDVEWARTVEIEVEVEEGSCGCDSVDDEQVLSALRDTGMDDTCLSESSIDTDERGCSNC